MLKVVRSRVRSRPRCHAQSGYRACNVIYTLCFKSLTWFDNLSSLCDHLHNVDVHKCALHSFSETVRLARDPVIEGSDSSAMFDYNEDECPWYYFDGSYKTLLGACLFLFGQFRYIFFRIIYSYVNVVCVQQIDLFSIRRF